MKIYFNLKKCHGIKIRKVLLLIKLNMITKFLRPTNYATEPKSPMLQTANCHCQLRLPLPTPHPPQTQ